MAHKLTLLYAAMCGVAILLQLAFGATVTGLFAPGGVPADGFAADVGLGIGAGLVVVLLSRWMSASFAWSKHLDAYFREVLEPLHPNDALGIATMSALAEELLFRGFLQAQLGLVAASLLFGLAHLPRARRHVPWTFAAIGMGFAFGWMVSVRGTLLAAFLCHFTINYFNMHALLWRDERHPT